MDLTVWQWTLGAFGALLVGLSKTGIPGLGIVPVALFAVVFPARASVGLLLPLLICGDVLAVAAYRRHTTWSHLVRLFPWTVLGILAGWPVVDRMKDAQMSRLIGAILIALVAVHVWRRRRASAEGGGAAEAPAGGGLYTAAIGLLAGFTTMVANAAGPIMILYLLAMRLPKMEFVGTQAWFFLAINVFKVPFNIHTGLITAETFDVTARLAVFVVAAALAGRLVLRALPQRLFEALALGFTAASAAWLVLRV